MAYSLRIDPRDGYLHVRVEGENTADVVRRYLSDVQTACASAGCPSVLIEERLTGPRMAIADIFKIVTEKSDEAKSFIRVVAFVDMNADGPGNMKFAENVAVNRGMTMSAFSSIAEAEAWMRKKLDPGAK
ncbi:MAG: hypothetical protein JO332_06635 [Planctomycetaceae bacterium]|nr:hypothetical protein [Planctomycetaceae bacterium]